MCASFDTSVYDNNNYYYYSATWIHVYMFTSKDNKTST